MRKIAVLLTCHNRRDKTLLCLEYFFKSVEVSNALEFSVFLVDDGSTDLTSEFVGKRFPSVFIVKGNGNLFWNQGMRLAWQTAISNGEYDFYFWLNDDTFLDEIALNRVFSTYDEIREFCGKEILLAVACRREYGNSIFSYGGRIDSGPVVPNGKIQSCKYINGNAVLVPKSVFQSIGILSDDFTHGMGDYDYGLRALAAGFNCYTTKEFLACCKVNEGIPKWCDPDVSFAERWKSFQSPKGLNIKEYILFRRKFWPKYWIIFVIKAYIKLFLPSLYRKISAF